MDYMRAPREWGQNASISPWCWAASEVINSSSSVISGRLLAKVKSQGAPQSSPKDDFCHAWLHYLVAIVVTNDITFVQWKEAETRHPSSFTVPNLLIYQSFSAANYLTDASWTHLDRYTLKRSMSAVSTVSNLIANSTGWRGFGWVWACVCVLIWIDWILMPTLWHLFN